MQRRVERMRKIVLYLNDEAIGITVDDNASDKEIGEKVLEEVINNTTYNYEEVDKWPKACTLCNWYNDDFRFCVNEDAEGCNDLWDCEKWEDKEEYE